MLRLTPVIRCALPLQAKGWACPAGNLPLSLRLQLQSRANPYGTANFG